jgi:hypothetical protein
VLWRRADRRRCAPPRSGLSITFCEQGRRHDLWAGIAGALLGRRPWPGFLPAFVTARRLYCAASSSADCGARPAGSWLGLLQGCRHPRMMKADSSRRAMKASTLAARRGLDRPGLLREQQDAQE